MLGPLINPAHPPLALIEGVYSPELVLPIAETLRVLGLSTRGGCTAAGWMKFHYAPTIVAELHDGEIKSLSTIDR